ncbi:hypothetical protein GQ457_05G005030 [Hibiscus cannabinus]
MKKVELVFITLPLTGHLISAVQLAKLLVGLNSNLSIIVVTLKTVSTTLKPVPTLTHSLPPAVNLPQTLRPVVRDVAGNIVEHSNSVPDSPRLAGFILDACLSFFSRLG